MESTGSTDGSQKIRLCTSLLRHCEEDRRRHYNEPADPRVLLPAPHMPITTPHLYCPIGTCLLHPALLRSFALYVVLYCKVLDYIYFAFVPAERQWSSVAKVLDDRRHDSRPIAGIW
jgi:hypothetical protein